MKLGVFVIIAVGLMFTFSLAEIETGSSKMIVGFNFDKNASDISVTPDLPSTDEIDWLSPSTFLTYLLGLGWWNLVIAFLFGTVMVLAVGKASFISASFNIPIEFAYAVFSTAVWYLIALDMFAIVRFVGVATDNAGWIFYLIWIFVTLYLIAFIFSIFSFIRSGQ